MQKKIYIGFMVLAVFVVQLLPLQSCINQRFVYGRDESDIVRVRRIERQQNVIPEQETKITILKNPEYVGHEKSVCISIGVVEHYQLSVKPRIVATVKIKFRPQSARMSIGSDSQSKSS